MSTEDPLFDEETRPADETEEDNDVDGFQEAEEWRQEREALRFESERDGDR